MQVPFFSIVIPTYNRMNDLIRCLSSLQNQTYKNFEVIVCDDGSTDNTFDVIKQFESTLSIKYLYEQNWGGPAHPRNVGVSYAKGKWICFLDSDDLFLPERMEIIKIDCPILMTILSSFNYYEK